MRAFVAGVLPLKIAQDMATSAESLVRKEFPGTPVRIEIVKEPGEKVVGNGSGIILVRFFVLYVTVLLTPISSYVI